MVLVGFKEHEIIASVFGVLCQTDGTIFWFYHISRYCNFSWFALWNEIQNTDVVVCTTFLFCRLARGSGQVVDGDKEIVYTHKDLNLEAWE